jgi:hypothetical protein
LTFVESIIRLKTGECKSPGKVGMVLEDGDPGSAIMIDLSVTIATVCLKNEISVAIPGIVVVAKCRNPLFVS